MRRGGEGVRESALIFYFLFVIIQQILCICPTFWSEILPQFMWVNLSLDWLVATNRALLRKRETDGVGVEVNEEDWRME